MSMPAPLVAHAAAARDTGPGTALVLLLDQLRELLARMPPAVYRACPAPRVSGSIGEHVRHCLDHVHALASTACVDELSYDHRRRGTSVESDPDAAIRQLDRLMEDVHRIASRGLDRTVRVSSLLDRGGPAATSRSTVARELAFVLNHTTHHLAIIALLLDRLGWDSPDGLGLAPATPRRH